MINYKNILDDTKLYIHVLVVWLVINSIRFVSLSALSQIVSIFLGVWGCTLLISILMRKGVKSIFSIPGTGIALLFIISVILSFLGNGLINPIKNVYTIIAVIINFYIIYTLPFKDNKKYYTKIMKTIVIATTLLNIINLLLLLFRVTYIIGDTDFIREVTFISFDWLRGRFTGLSGNANGLSRVGLSGIIAAVLILFYEYPKGNETKKWKRFFYISIVINVLVILLAQSRASLYAISLGVGLAFFTAILVYKKTTILGKTLVFLLSILIVLISVKITTKVSDLSISYYPKIVISTSDEGEDLTVRDDEATNDDFSNGRLTLITNGAKATIKYNPVFGLSYSEATQKVQQYLSENNVEIHAHLINNVGQMHNTLVQAFVYYGILGLTTLSIFVLFIMKVFASSILNKNKLFHGENANKIIMLSFLLGIFIVMNMVEWVFIFDFENHLINFMFLFTLGTFVNFIQSQNKEAVSCTLDNEIRKRINVLDDL